MENKGNKAIIVGDWNNISIINNSSNIDINELIQENIRLKADLEWAWQQLKIKDVLLKKFCDEY